MFLLKFIQFYIYYIVIFGDVFYSRNNATSIHAFNVHCPLNVIWRMSFVYCSTTCGPILIQFGSATYSVASWDFLQNLFWGGGHVPIRTKQNYEFIKIG